MIRLTVMYNLAPDQDEAEFLEWRLGEHQKNNLSQPDVLRVDFTRVEDSWPEGTRPRHRFITTADWPDRESFEASFYAEETQASLRKNLGLLNDAEFLISEVLVNEYKVED